MIVYLDKSRVVFSFGDITIDYYGQNIGIYLCIFHSSTTLFLYPFIKLICALHLGLTLVQTTLSYKMTIWNW